ncbi:hypothetical protein JDV02_007140 [Purpureocillium takamizusanense]|uniref:Rhodopsin domain-containing protein n=1 Tax=Purpureocillium takamizusanense TaxID=2060973 RepID=A0A9Q8VCY8_9HYPO|nr:uncharacterized protein JDV02_007140 [Purpureocillium takamizusanense]UNI21123.1 hypothetical protein JDV02_007140 [Purpureocillium takamizusanense]
MASNKLPVGSNIPGASNADLVRIPCIVFFAVTPIFLAIRIWNRLSRRTGLGWDDWTILVSFACTLAVQILMMLACNYGFGKHKYHLTEENLLMALKLFYIAQIFYKLTINLTKASILLLYLRIFVQKWFRISCYSLIGIVVAYMIATTASAIWQCNPISGAWDKSSNPTCISLTKNWYANAGYSIATDVLILLLPMQPLWSSKLPVNQKRALMLVFALGGFVTITSILRATTLNFSTTSPDSTYDITSTLWTMIEENVAIICACLPMCRIILAWVFPKAFANASSAAAGSHGPTYTFGQKRSGAYSQTSGNREWKPYSGPNEANGTSRSVVQHSDDTSEEFILTTVHSVNNNTTIQDDHAIRKTTQYAVSYEREHYNSRV